MHDSGTARAGSPKRWATRWALPIVLAALAMAWIAAARGNQWWAEAIRSRQFVHLGILLMASALALQWTLQALAALGGKRKVRLNADQRGLAVLEFALVLPIAMFLVMMMAQTAMLMVGNLLVHYSAFCATRSAIVWIPADLPPAEPRNVVDGLNGKLAKIREAAVLALAPAGGAMQTGALSDPTASGVAPVFSDAGRRAWLSKVMTRKLNYARAHTQVRLMGLPTAVAAPASASPGTLVELTDRYGFNERDDITVQVQHDFYLAVPYVAWIFGARNPDQPGEFSASITASYTLVNQGKDDRVKIETLENSNELLLPR